MFYIIFPGGDRTKLCVHEITYTDELCDYDMASRHNYRTEWDALEYAKGLVVQHGLTLEVPAGYGMYLD